MFKKIIPVFLLVILLFTTGCTDADLLDSLTGMTGDSASGTVTGKVSLPYSTKTASPLFKDSASVIEVTLLQTNIKTECDSEGNFSLSSVPAGTYYIYANLGDSYKVVRSSVVVTEGETTTVDNFYLAKTGSISGKVTIEDADEYSGILVKEISTGIETYTDSQGAYILTGIPAGIWSLSISKAGLNEITRSNVAITSDATTQLADILLTELGSVSTIATVAVTEYTGIQMSAAELNNKILLSCTPSGAGNNDIYLLDIDGMTSSKILSDYTSEIDPEFAKTDTIILYTKNGSIYSNDLSTGTDSLIVSGGSDPFWNYKTSELFFTKNGGIWSRQGFTDYESDAMITNIGSNPCQELNSGKILFNRGNELWLMDSAGSNQTLVATSGRNACWMSSQYEVLYEWDGDIYRKNVMSSNAYNVVSNAVAPVWLPAYSKVVYYSTTANKIQTMQL